MLIAHQPDELLLSEDDSTDMNAAISPATGSVIVVLDPSMSSSAVLVVVSEETNVLALSMMPGLSPASGSDRPMA
jgi:hypothetical protein